MKLQFITLADHVIEAKIIPISNIGNNMFITKISLTHSNIKISFTFQER